MAPFAEIIFLVISGCLDVQQLPFACSRLPVLGSKCIVLVPTKYFHLHLECALPVVVRTLAVATMTVNRMSAAYSSKFLTSVLFSAVYSRETSGCTTLTPHDIPNECE